MKKLPVKTFTFDNDPVFCMYEVIAKELDVETYFTALIPPRIKVKLKTEMVL